MTTSKIPVRTVYDNSNIPIGLAEYQVGEVISINHGGTNANTVANAKINLGLDNSNVRALFTVAGSGSYDNTTGIITVTGGVTSVGGVSGTISNAQLASSVTSGGLLANTNLTGTPVAPTASLGSNTTQIATTSFVTLAVANLIDSAPGALDTLNELAAAINDDSSFFTTIANQLNDKANTASLTTANVSEVTNLYFTNNRVIAALTGGENISIAANGRITAEISDTVTTIPFTNTNLNFYTTKNILSLSKNTFRSGEYNFNIDDGTNYSKIKNDVIHNNTTLAYSNSSVNVGEVATELYYYIQNNSLILEAINGNFYVDDYYDLSEQYQSNATINVKGHVFLIEA